MQTFDITPTYGGKELLLKPHLVANNLGFRNKFINCSLLYRNGMQHPIDVGGRTVYSSAAPLKHVQNRIGKHLAYDFDQLDGNETAIACRKRLNIRKALAGNAGSAVLVVTDIVGFYDHVTRRKIVTTLKSAGYPNEAAEILANLLVVERTIGEGENAYELRTLQQGSPASNAMANMVGRIMFDIPIVRWVKEHMPNGKVVRYSDNIALFLSEDPGRELIEEYKKVVRGAAESSGFRTHGWATLRRNNKALAQRYLGMVFNEKASVGRHERDRIKGIMFNALLHGVYPTAKKYLEKRGVAGLDEMEEGLVMDMFARSVIGYAMYVRSVDVLQGDPLVKLAKLVQIAAIDNKRVDIRKRRRISGISNHKEGVGEYLTRASRALIDAK